MAEGKTYRKRRNWELISLVVILVLALGLQAFLGVRQGSAHERILDDVALGSGVDSLRAVLKKDNVWGSSVMQWIPPEDAAPPTERDAQLGTVNAVETEYGTFRRRILDDLDGWHPSEELERSFSGEISVFVERGFFRDDAVLTFTYIDGVLVDKGWGYLPG